MDEVTYYKNLVYINAHFYSFWMSRKEYEKYQISNIKY